MPDSPGHGGVLPIGNPKLLGSLLHDPGQWSIVVWQTKGHRLVDDMMVKSAHEPTDKRFFGCIIGRCGEDMIHAVVKLRTIRGKVGGVEWLRRLGIRALRLTRRSN